jgi:hypothetical protein
MSHLKIIFTTEDWFKIDKEMGFFVFSDRNQINYLTIARIEIIIELLRIESYCSFLCVYQWTTNDGISHLL